MLAVTISVSGCVGQSAPGNATDNQSGSAWDRISRTLGIENELQDPTYIGGVVGAQPPPREPPTAGSPEEAAATETVQGSANNTEDSVG